MSVDMFWLRVVGPLAFEFLADKGCMIVTVFKPHDRATQKLVPASPYIEGNTVFTVAVQDKTQEELDADLASLASQMRSQRNQKLAECDWTQLSDAPVDKSVWATYRQALRDATSQEKFPLEVTWPVKP